MPGQIKSRIKAVAGCLALLAGCTAQAQQPNVLLLVAEDMSPRVGAFGDAVANTPNLDKLARGGVRFLNTFTTAGVCAPSRAALITGVHQNSLGAGHMRTRSAHWPLQYLAVPDEQIKAFPELLRRSGYYTFTDSKLDYQFSGPQAGTGPATIWDAEGINNRWRGRASGQPFFGMINFMITHESMLFADADVTSPQLQAMRRQIKASVAGKGQAVSPDAVTVPPFLPDLPQVRRDIATQYQNVSAMDAQIGEIIEALANDGLLESTIIIWTTDHGDGLPRYKREIFDTGIHVPMIVHWPAAFRPADRTPGSTAAGLVSFVDIAPAILQMADVTVPGFMQGESFLDSERRYVFAARDRMDSAEDRQRAVRDDRFKYIRSDYPERPGYMDLDFRNQLQTMRAWRDAFRAERVSAVQAAWFRPRAKEALFDTKLDPYEMQNLAGDRRHRRTLRRLRRALDRWQARVPDLGAIAESQLAARFWPDGQQPVTPPPAFSWDSEAQTLAVTAAAGASIRYRVADGPWRLYQDELALRPGQALTARAVRYGWQESEDAQFTCCAASSPSPRNASTARLN